MLKFNLGLVGNPNTALNERDRLTYYYTVGRRMYKIERDFRKQQRRQQLPPPRSGEDTIEVNLDRVSLSVNGAAHARKAINFGESGWFRVSFADATGGINFSQDAWLIHNEQDYEYLFKIHAGITFWYNPHVFPITEVMNTSKLGSKLTFKVVKEEPSTLKQLGQATDFYNTFDKEEEFFKDYKFIAWPSPTE